MKDEPEKVGWPTAGGTGTPGMPVVADRAIFQAELDALRVREKAHTREGDAIAAARRRLPRRRAPADRGRPGGVPCSPAATAPRPAHAGYLPISLTTLLRH